MQAVTRDEVERDLRRLEHRVQESFDASRTDELAVIRGILRQAVAAIESVRAGSLSGAYEISLSADQQAVYFPPAGPPGPAVSQTRVREADERWGTALERGRRHRLEALGQIGPVLTPSEASARLGISGVTLNNWRRQNKLLALRFDDHQYLYPLFQFAASPDEGERGVLRHLDEILALLGDVSGWQRARFFVTPAPFLGGRTPLEALRSGAPIEVDRVRRLARAAGEMGA